MTDGTGEVCGQCAGTGILPDGHPYRNSESYTYRHGYRCNECDGTGKKAKEPTYEVSGGQGHMVLARGLTRKQAETYRKDFDRECASAGLNNPPTWIKKETRR